MWLSTWDSESNATPTSVGNGYKQEEVAKQFPPWVAYRYADPYPTVPKGFCLHRDLWLPQLQNLMLWI